MLWMLLYGSFGAGVVLDQDKHYVSLRLVPIHVKQQSLVLILDFGLGILVHCVKLRASVSLNINILPVI